MRWVTNPLEAQYMRGRQEQNRARSIPAEEWMAKKLQATPHQWTRQAMHGYRLFDFWCHELGMAIEVDGPEHVAGYDEYRDGYNFYRSAIVVVRVRNFNEQDAAGALREITVSFPWAARRAAMGPGKQLLLAHGFEMARSPTKVAQKKQQRALV